MRSFSIDPARLRAFSVAKSAGFAAARDANRDCNGVREEIATLKANIAFRVSHYPQNAKPTDVEMARIETLEREAARLRLVANTVSETAMHHGRIGEKVQEYAASKGVYVS